jgi:Tfp pilus assembly protein PilN
MINLLPPDSKEAYRYARRNRTLLRWVILMTASLCVAVLLVAGGYLYLRQQITNTQSSNRDTQTQLDSQNLGTIQKQVTTISEQSQVSSASTV